jgi:hypothetical protein
VRCQPQRVAQRRILEERPLSKADTSCAEEVEHGEGFIFEDMEQEIIRKIVHGRHIVDCTMASLWYVRSFVLEGIYIFIFRRHAFIPKLL